MAEQYAVFVEGLGSATAGLDTIPEAIKLAMVRAVNETIDHARAQGSRRIRQQVNFSASYLNERLTVTKRATKADTEARITGRHRPTSLARFTTGGQVGNRKGVTVQVKPGFARFMRRAFLIRLRSGTADLDTRSNLGLALRLKPGESIKNKKDFVRLSGNLYLLYGPSVDQVFADVAEEISPQEADFLESEFLRLVDLT